MSGRGRGRPLKRTFNNDGGVIKEENNNDGGVVQQETQNITTDPALSLLREIKTEADKMVAGGSLSSLLFA